MINVDARAIGREVRASYAFVERNWNLVKRYWGWEIAFLVYSAASSMSIMFIGKAQGGSPQATNDLILYLTIGTLVWSFLNSVFNNMAETVSYTHLTLPTT